MADKKFVDGMIFKLPREGSPDFVSGSLSLKIDEFVKWMRDYVAEHPDEAWINIDLLVGRSGKPYAALNEYKKSGLTEKPPALEYPKDDINPDDVPF